MAKISGVVDDRLTVPCQWCRTSTPMLATRCCDRCWELQRRIQTDTNLARRMLASWLGVELFVVKHYSGDKRPILKGNGFDGLEVGETREEAEEFVAFINNQLGLQR